ncbi:MAG: penicillin-binding transpeptidase domain-containing protein [Betaproteobacteria bacterium]|nr:penicillin-binding transpeptidase domain-containing protein [Betaproteobacteria bacterium]
MSRVRKAVTFNHNPLLQLSLSQWRARLVLVVLLAGMATLLGRSLYLQGVHNEFLQAKGESRYARVLEVPATRGRIADRNGNLLAVSTPVSSIWALPSDASRLEPGQLRQLAQLLEMNVAELNNRIVNGRDFVFLKRQVSPELAGKVAKLDLPGIYQQSEFRRYYPSGEVMAHMLGFTNVEDRGQEGVELAFERLLAGQPGARRVIKDRRGQVVEDVESIRLPRDGEDVALAMDARIQYLAYSSLREAVQQHRAKAGSVVVIDVRTGEVLALVNAPAFNPNNRAHLSGEQLRNRVFTDTFEPGSVMKPFVAAMAIESGKFRASTVIDTYSGSFNIGNNTIHDTHPYRTLTVAEIIRKSSNIGTARMALAFEPEHMWALYDRLGFGSPPGLGFPGEASGNLRPAKTWKSIEQATMSYGHGISVSLIQIARAYLAFARDGDLVPLSLTRVDAPPVGVQVFSPRVAREVRQIMETAVSPGGTGVRAQITGYRVAGKTGTANKIENGRYVNKYVSSFVGLAPVSNPRLVVAVMIDEPSANQHFGGTVAAPVFAQVAEGALRALGVAPNAPLAPLQLTAMGVERGSDREGMR